MQQKSCAIVLLWVRIDLFSVRSLPVVDGVLALINLSWVRVFLSIIMVGDSLYIGCMIVVGAS